MNYKVGDKIRVKSQEMILSLRGEGKRVGGVYFQNDMLDNCGKEFIVSSIDARHNVYHIKGHPWVYNDAMVENPSAILRSIYEV